MSNSSLRRIQIITFRCVFVFILLAPLPSFCQSISLGHGYTLLAVDDKAVLTYPNDIATEHPLKINEVELAKNIHNNEHVLDIDLSRKGEILKFEVGDKLSLVHSSLNSNQTIRLFKIPLWWSLIPPLLAIILALVFKEVIVSLFAGVFSGALILGGMRLTSPLFWLQSVFDVVQTFIINALNDSGHLSVIVFSIVIGGMVAIISKNGGMEGIVRAFSGFANSSKNAQLSTYFLGMSIFFDDYANTLIVGNCMRPVTDKFRISREKLAYIVDSTAAPIAALAFITTWIGFELGQIEIGMKDLDGYTGVKTPYAVFFQSLKYAFYPILTLIFMYLLIRSKRDYGPMLSIERKVRATGIIQDSAMIDEDQSVEDLSPVPHAPRHWSNAVIPVITVILVTIYGLVHTGMGTAYEELQRAGSEVGPSWTSIWNNMSAIMSSGGDGFMLKLGTLIGLSDSYVGLLWGSLAGTLAAIILTVAKRIMDLNQTMDTLVLGFKTMVPAILILTFAWSLALVTEEMETAHFLSQAIQGKVSPFMLPAILFPLSAIIAFSTGSSWSTMAILYPIAIPATWALSQTAGLDTPQAQELLFNVVAIIISASVLGDHCSPISDTTILSSLACQCNHIMHVKTQLPYALTVGVIAWVANVLSTILGGGWLIFLIFIAVGTAAMYGAIRFFGKEVQEYHG